MNLLKVSAQIGPSIPGPRVRGFHRTSLHSASESVLTLQIKTYVVAVPPAAGMDRLRGRFGGQTVSRRPKRRFRNSSHAHVPSTIWIAGNPAAAFQFQHSASQ
jgi:hypothetical protein